MFVCWLITLLLVTRKQHIIVEGFINQKVFLTKIMAPIRNCTWLPTQALDGAAADSRQKFAGISFLSPPPPEKEMTS